MSAVSTLRLGPASEAEASPATIYEDGALRISGMHGGARTLFVAFTGIGHRLGALQREEFVRVAHAEGENSVLFVQDKTRTWYNEPDVAAKLAPVVAAWAERCDRTVTIGNSMGGFGAVVLAEALKADAAIAFSPQFSVSPDIIPQETRWREFTSKIPEFRYASAAEHMTDRCSYYLFQGAGGKDWYQIGGFPIRPNIFQFVVPDGPHNLAAILKARGELSAIVAACAAGEVAALTEIMSGCGAVRRSAEDDPYCGPLRTFVEAPRDEAGPSSAAIAALSPEEERRRQNRIRRQQDRRDRKKASRLERKAAERAASGTDADSRSEPPTGRVDVADAGDVSGAASVFAASWRGAGRLRRLKGALLGKLRQGASGIWRRPA